METSIKIEVRSTQIDVMGHVNNATFLEYMEWGREDWYSKIGVDYDGLAQRNLGTMVVNIDIDYINEARQGQVLTVKTKPLKRGQKSFVLLHQIFNEEDELVATAKVTSVVADLNKRISVELVPEIASCYE